MTDLLSRIRWVACVAILVLVGSNARAGLLTVNYAGNTIAGSQLAAGGPFATDLSGNSFEIHAVFETPATLMGTGFGLYTVDSASVIVGATTYVIDPSALSFKLFDTGNTVAAGFYLVQLISDGTSIEPGYGTATPTVTGASAAPTVFSDYAGSLSNSVSFAVKSGGTLTIVYDNNVGVTASITQTTPEPATVVTALIGGAGLVLLCRRRRV